MDRIDVAAQPRQVLGKKVRHLRRHGITPANLSGLHEPSRPLQVDARALSILINKQGKNSIVNLTIDGESSALALLKDYRVHPIKNTLIHVDFQRVAMGEKLTLDVDLQFVGESPVENRTDLMLLRLLNSVRVECLPGNLPSHIEVDISGLAEADQAVHIGDLKLSDDITVLSPPEEVIARVTTVHVAAEDEAEPTEAEETAAEAAEESSDGGGSEA